MQQKDRVRQLVGGRLGECSGRSLRSFVRNMNRLCRTLRTQSLEFAHGRVEIVEKLAKRRAGGLAIADDGAKDRIQECSPSVCGAEDLELVDSRWQGQLVLELLSV